MKTTTKILTYSLVCCLGPTGFCHAVTLQNLAAMSFDTIDYSLPLTGSISLGTNGAIDYTGAFAGDGIGVAAQVEIQDTPGTVVEVSCAAGTLSDGASHTLAMDNTIAIGNGQTAAWGTTPLCNGLGNALETTTVDAVAANNIIFIGGRLTPASLVAGDYSTASTGGQPIQVQVTVQ